MLQRWALRQHFCKPRCILSLDLTEWQLQSGDTVPGLHRRKLFKNVRESFNNRAIVGVDPETPAQAHNDRQVSLSSTPMTGFEAILNMIVLSADRHDRQSCDDMASRTTAKAKLDSWCSASSSAQQCACFCQIVASSKGRA